MTKSDTRTNSDSDSNTHSSKNNLRPDFFIINVDGKMFNVSRDFLENYKDTLLSKSILMKHDLPGLLYHQNNQIIITDIDSNLFKIILSNMREHSYHKINQYTDDDVLEELYHLAKLFLVQTIIDAIEEIKNKQKIDRSEMSESSSELAKNIEIEIEKEKSNIKQQGGSNRDSNRSNNNSKGSEQTQLEQILELSDYDTDLSEYDSYVSEFDSDDNNDQNNDISEKTQNSYHNEILPYDETNVNVSNEEQKSDINFDDIDFYSLVTSKDPIDQENLRKIMELELYNPFGSSEVMVKFSNDPKIKKYLESLAYQNDNPNVVSTDYSSDEGTEASIYLTSEENNENISNHSFKSIIKEQTKINDFDNNSNDISKRISYGQDCTCIDEWHTCSAVEDDNQNNKKINSNITDSENTNSSIINSISSSRSNKSSVTYHSTQKCLRNLHGDNKNHIINTKCTRI